MIWEMTVSFIPHSTELKAISDFPNVKFWKIQCNWNLVMNFVNQHIDISAFLKQKANETNAFSLHAFGENIFKWLWNDENNRKKSKKNN